MTSSAICSEGSWPSSHIPPRRGAAQAASKLVGRAVRIVNGSPRAQPEEEMAPDCVLLHSG
jgi:hypothetical protein